MVVASIRVSINQFCSGCVPSHHFPLRVCCSFIGGSQLVGTTWLSSFGACRCYGVLHRAAPWAPLPPHHRLLLSSLSGCHQAGRPPRCVPPWCAAGDPRHLKVFHFCRPAHPPLCRPAGQYSMAAGSGFCPGGAAAPLPGDTSASSCGSGRRGQGKPTASVQDVRSFCCMSFSSA